MSKKIFALLFVLALLALWVVLKLFYEPRPTTDDNQPYQHELIRLDNPAPFASLNSPLEIVGQARGFWFFEASFPVKLYSASGELLAIAIATAESDWMTEDFVPFRAELAFEISEPQDAYLVLERDNPSGLEENYDEFRIPLKLLASGAGPVPGSEQETLSLKVYLQNNSQDFSSSCDEVMAVSREVPATPAIARAALEELIKGPSDEEIDLGFFSSLNDGLEIQSLTIENGLAKVDFNSALDYQVGGSCRVSAIRAQIEETLRQFPTVSDVLISIDGRSEDILQP